MRHLISMLLQNEAGALARVAGLFASRGYNIESLTAASTPHADASRLTLVVFGDDAVIAQIIKQSAKLIDVLEITDLTGCAHVERELLVVRTDATGDAVDAVDACVARFGGRLLQRSAGQSLIEYSGRADEVDAFLVDLRLSGHILDQARSGIAAIEHPLA